jgi:hypothetical protein
MEPQPTQIGIHVTHDSVRGVRKVPTQNPCGFLAVTLKVVPARGEAEWLDFAIKLCEQEGFALAEEKEFLDAPAVVLGELIPEFTVESLRLLERRKLFIGNKKPIIALEKVGDDENLVACRRKIARFEVLKSIKVDSGTGSQFRRSQLPLITVRPQLARELGEINWHGSTL